MADITDLQMEGFLKRKRENTSSPSISPLNKRKPEICTVDRNNASNKWTSEEKNNLLATVTECTSNASTEWKSVSESLNVMFGSNRTAKSCQNQYKRIMAFKDTAQKVEMVNSSCQTDISLNPNDNFVFMKIEEEFIELSTNASDSVDTAYESESSSSVLRTMLVYDRLNRLGVSSSYCVAVDTITKLGKRYTGFLVKFLEEGKFIRLIGDNLNFTVGTSHETKSQHKHMVHMFTSLALISDHHFLTKPVEPEISLNHLSIDNILLSKQEYEIIRHEVIGLIIDTAVKFLPNIAFLKHSNAVESAYISAKTEVIPLPCLPYNENKYQDDVKILAWYQQLLDTIKKEAGADAELKFVIGGDQLTRERLSEAMLLRLGNIDPQERFSHIGRCVAEFFHLGMNYLEKVIFGELWNVEGVVEKGTLRGECERISRKTVDPKIMKAYEADKDFVDNYLSANIIEALMSFFGMDNRNDFPTKNLPPTSFDDDKAKETWTYDTLGQFVDKYVFPSWSGHVADDQVLEDATEVNNYIELVLDNGQTILIPVAVSEITFKQLKPDKVKDYAHYSLEVGLIFRYFLNLCKEPVREQFLPLLKMMMVQLRGHSINAKYPKEILRMLVQQYSVMGLQEACQVFCASFVNLHGRKDGNVPADLVQEWSVKESKKHIKHMFSNKENSTIEHKTSALPSIHKIASNFDVEVGTLVRAKRHKDKSYDDEICVIMEDLREILPFTHKEGRSYETFKNIPKSLCEKVDGLKLQKWFKKHKNSFPL